MNKGLSTPQKEASQDAMQPCEHQQVCRNYEQVPHSAGHFVQASSEQFMYSVPHILDISVTEL